MGAGASAAEVGLESKSEAVESEWVLDAAAQFLESPAWQQQVDKFVDANCERFSVGGGLGGEEGFYLEQFDCWREFQGMVEGEGMVAPGEAAEGAAEGAAGGGSKGLEPVRVVAVPVFV